MSSLFFFRGVERGRGERGTRERGEEGRREGGKGGGGLYWKGSPQAGGGGQPPSVSKQEDISSRVRASRSRSRSWWEVGEPPGVWSGVLSELEEDAAADDERSEWCQVGGLNCGERPGVRVPGAALPGKNWPDVLWIISLWSG